MSNIEFQTESNIQILNVEYRISNWVQLSLIIEYQTESNIIQLMHSFEVNIRICQPENSDVHRGEAEVNITFEGWLILMLTKKRMHQLFCYMTLSLYYFHIYKFTQVRCS